MADIFDYLKWRGDLTFDTSPFNEIDALIFSRLSYIPFDTIVSSCADDKITIEEAAEIFLAVDELNQKITMVQDASLIKMLAESERFGHLYLSGYTNEFDFDTQKQFAAIIIEIAKDEHFVSFRGTDNTLVGWKEDFNMSFTTPVPSQISAVAYLERTASILKGNFRVGGHSKGGNLAVFSSSFCSEETQERIIKIYNHDGPGLEADYIIKDGYSRIKDRIKTILPQSSVVGMMLEQEGDYSIVKSKEVGFFQHDMYSWEVLRDDFICLESVTNGSKFIDSTLKDWVAKTSPEEREAFIDAVFYILVQTHAHTVRELTSNWYKNAQIILKTYKRIDEPLKQRLSSMLGMLVSAAKENVVILKPQTLPILKGKNKDKKS